MVELGILLDFRCGSWEMERVDEEATLFQVVDIDSTSVDGGWREQVWTIWGESILL